MDSTTNKEQEAYTLMQPPSSSNVLRAASKPMDKVEAGIITCNDNLHISTLLINSLLRGDYKSLSVETKINFVHI
jgi:hypothetical protein